MMKILSFLSIIFILEVGGRGIRNHITNTVCLEVCKCVNTKNISLEISNCSRPINISSDFVTASETFTTIRFNQVTISNMSANSLGSLSDLDHIEFNGTEIIHLDSKAFAKNEPSTLNFANCKFSKFSSIECLYLEELIVTNSNLKKIPKLNELPSLTTLHLGGNKIGTIDENTFIKSELLEEVNLTNNELKFLPPNLFQLNGHLSILDLSHNLLTYFSLEKTTSLDILRLAYNKLTRFDGNSSRYLKHLQLLDLSHNKITQINQDTFVNMPEIGIINLSYNRLTTLDNKTFAFNSNLRTLILDGNNFKTLPIFVSFSDVFQRIESFSCRMCGIVSLSSYTFGSMPGLGQLVLSENNLTILDPKAFSLITGLNSLDLSKNKLTKLGGNLFSDNKQLSEINLSGNPLKTLDPKDFIFLKNLKKLDVSNAQLTSLWADNYEYVLNELEQLIITNNQIEDITTSDLKVMPNLKFIDLENNPIQCTIHLANAIKWLTYHQVYSSDGANFLKTNEKLSEGSFFAQFFEHNYDHKNHWLKLAESVCLPSNDESQNFNTDKVMNMITENMKEIDSVPKVNAPQLANAYDEDYDGYSIDDADSEEIEDEVESREEFSLIQATNLMSITSVFFVTALIVLSAAVPITLMILKKYSPLNINNDNLPRIKIPRWDTQSQKKHSGSIYRPLSEEILTPPTPKFNRYEFKATPNVHNSTLP